jgi:DNA polymerase-3 subunit beta|nr:MAG TPA: beta clamp protein [Caudoviricetes sp.]
MKIQAQSSLLLRQALQKAAKCIDSKTTIAILTNVLLTQRKEDGKFFFVSATTDSELTIPASLTIVEGSFKEDAVLPITSLLSLLSTLPADCVVTMDLSQDKERSMNIEYCTQNGDNVKKGNVSLIYFSAESFPRVAQPDDASIHISLPMATFSNVLSHAGKFVSDSELRPVMKCLCIDVAEDRSEVTFVASNGHTLIKLIHTNNPETGGSDFFREGTPGKILVYSVFFKTLSVFDDCEDIDIEANENMVRFTSGDITFVCKKAAGQYPNYNSVIPKNNPYTVVVDKRELASVVKRVALFASESSNLIVLKKDGMFLDIAAQDIDFSMSATDQVLINDSTCPEGYRIGFKASSLLDTLAPIPSDTVCLHLGDQSRAATITANESSPLALTQLMPMIMND